MAINGCTREENIRDVFARRGDARMRRRSHKLQWNQSLERRNDALANFAEVGITAKLAEGGWDERSKSKSSQESPTALDTPL